MCRCQFHLILFLPPAIFPLLPPLSSPPVHHPPLPPAPTILPRLRAPERSARVVGGKARQRAKLGVILEQVHSNIVAEKAKGQFPYKEIH